MDLFKLDIGEIAALANDVAITGAVKLATAYTDDTFDFLVMVAQVIYDGSPR